MSLTARSALGLVCGVGAAFAVCARPAAAADWWTIVSRPNLQVDTDADSLSCQADVCSTWQRLTSPTKTVRVRVEFDCPRRRMRSLTQVYDRGAPAGGGSSVKLPGTWSPVTPATMGAEALVFACSVRDQHPSPKLSGMSLGGLWFMRAEPQTSTARSTTPAPPPRAIEPAPTPAPVLKPPVRLAQAAPSPPATKPAPPKAAAPPAKQAVKAPAPRPTTPPAAAPTPAGGIEVQIVAGSQSEARTALDTLARTQPGLLAGHATHVARKPGGPEIYRALIGGFASRGAAQGFCRTLTQAGHACFVRPASPS